MSTRNWRLALPKKKGKYPTSLYPDKTLHPPEQVQQHGQKYLRTGPIYQVTARERTSKYVYSKVRENDTMDRGNSWTIENCCESQEHKRKSISSISLQLKLMDKPKAVNKLF